MECFTIYADEIEGRIDPLYLKNKAIIEDPKTKFTLVKLGGLLKSKVQYGANEIAIDGKPRQDIRYIRITDIDEFGNLRSDEWKTAQNIEEKYLLNEGDILFARTGATAGKCFLYKNEYGKSIFAGYLIRFIFDTSKVNPKYIFYYTQLERYKLWVKSIQRPSGQPNINSEEFKSFNFPLLSLQAQNHIVQLMDNAYDFKKQKETEAQQLINSINDYVLEELGIKLPELKDEMTFFVYVDKIEGRIDPFYYRPGIKEIKRTLEQKHGTHFLGEVIKDIYRYPTFYGIRYLSKGIRVIKGESISKEGIIDGEQEFDYIDEETHKRFIKTHIKKDDLIFTVRGIIGKIGYYNLNDEANINANVIKIRLINNNNPEFFWIYLNSKIGQLFIDTLSSGQVQKTITVPDIKNIPIVLPPLSIQNKIADEVKVRMQKAKQLQKEAKEVFEETKEIVEKIIL